MKTMKQMMLSRATFVILLSNVPLTLSAQDNLSYSALASTPLKQMKEVYTTYTTDISQLSQDEQFYHLTNQYSIDFDFKMNSFVEKEIEIYRAINNAYVRKSLKNGKRYFPIIERILERKNMPLALKYLPAIESKMNPRAKSYRGAAGIWQIMPATARELKLRVNSQVDERRNVPKSTDKATKYLQRLNKINNDWTLTIAAYNCGQGNVNKAIRKAGSRNYWELRHFLPRETQRYIPRFFAIVYLMEKYDMDNTPNANLVSFTVKVKKIVAVKPAMKLSDLTIKNSNKNNTCDNNKVKISNIKLLLPYKKAVIFKTNAITKANFYEHGLGVYLRHVKRLNLGEGTIENTNKITKSKSQLKTFNQSKNEAIKPQNIQTVGFKN